ncbi:MAG: hypothetical protein KY443_09720 [Actinobacteria bacterium]|nr:hypothetical protein [Actinomycetota bacterium]
MTGVGYCSLTGTARANPAAPGNPNAANDAAVPPTSPVGVDAIPTTRSGSPASPTPQ